MAMSNHAAAAHNPSRRLPLLAIVACVSALALVWGWSVRDEYYLSAESGLGYRLGILGLAFMVLLLGYSLRKRARAMRSWGPIRLWFGIHMFLGVAGPVAILFHANFRLGSLNSNVALLCVILVAGSGLVGRFIYPKIHYGLYGRRASLRELRLDADASRDALGAAARVPGVSQQLADFESHALAEDCGPLASVWRLVALPIRSRFVKRRCVRMARAADGAHDGSGLVSQIDAHLLAVRWVAEFRGYERLFSLWHAFHLPFCIMLFVAAAVHVLAVHMY
jgi:hypothetical protein